MDFINLKEGLVDFSSAKDFVSDAVLCDLLEVLVRNSSLNHVRLDNNHINDTNSSFLAAALKANTFVHTLSLVSCNMSTYAVSNICRSLKLRGTIRVLDISQNPNVKDGCASDIAALISTVPLTELRMMGTKLGSEGGAILANAIAKSDTFAQPTTMTTLAGTMTSASGAATSSLAAATAASSSHETWNPEKPRQSLLQCQLPFTAGFSSLRTIDIVLKRNRKLWERTMERQKLESERQLKQQQQLQQQQQNSEEHDGTSKGGQENNNNNNNSNSNNNGESSLVKSIGAVRLDGTATIKKNMNYTFTRSADAALSDSERAMYAPPPPKTTTGVCVKYESLECWADPAVRNTLLSLHTLEQHNSTQQMVQQQQQQRYLKSQRNAAVWKAYDSTSPYL